MEVTNSFNDWINHIADNRMVESAVTLKHLGHWIKIDFCPPNVNKWQFIFYKDLQILN